MGKIYDALKKAEEEARLLKGVEQLSRMSTPQKPKTSYSPDKSEKPLKQDTRKKYFSFSFLDQKERVGISPHKDLDGDLFFLHNPKSFISEQYRLLRSHILSLNKTKSLQTLLITSTMPNEGKTVTAYNLAICLAQGINKHVLLIDSDMRKPDLHQYFGQNLNGGLSKILSNGKELTQALIKTNITNLDLLTAGIPPDNPSELMESERLEQFIQEVKSTFSDNFVIIDSSPIQQTSEPRILAKHVDGIILVVASGQTDRELIAKSIDALGREKILGIVFNKSREKSKGYRYNYYYNPRDTK